MNKTLTDWNVPSVPRLKGNEVEPDEKAGPRIVSPETLRLARELMRTCLCCDWHWTEAHHLIRKGSPHFGDDLLENLVPLCRLCHGALHGNPYDLAAGGRVTAEIVRDKIGIFLASSAGAQHLAYVVGKLGPVPAMVWLGNYGVRICQHGLLFGDYCPRCEA